MLKAIVQAGLHPPATPKKWVVQCQNVGRGLPALQYLSRDLYRGVISNKNIVDDNGSQVTFQYQNSATGKIETRQLAGEEFMQLVLQHTLPKGFRRARDYGFLHGNAKRILRIVQWILKVAIPIHEKLKRTKFICAKCHGAMSIVGFIPPKPKPS